ncbi:MAG: hypothetical protein B9S34_11880 [Opitutia bacterium Tous-C1TDCM]|nr:MAG: hypothetical protein B9S34_11880 [Opitutae bacterium Tous-C1TDCM]
MARKFLPLLLPVLLAAAGPVSGQPENPPAAGPSPVLNAASAQPAPPPAPRRNRAISGEVAAALAAAAPKYTPPPPKPEPKPEAEQPDLRETDKPKNGIVRLPKYVVQEAKPPVFRERDINTQKGLTDIAMRRYMSEGDRALNRYTIPFIGVSNEARALAMYEEDERLKNMADLGDAAANAAKTDAAAGAFIKREAQETYLRKSDFGWSNGNRK